MELNDKQSRWAAVYTGGGGVRSMVRVIFQDMMDEWGMGMNGDEWGMNGR